MQKKDFFILFLNDKIKFLKLQAKLPQNTNQNNTPEKNDYMYLPKNRK